MISLRVFAIVAIVVALALVLVACVPGIKLFDKPEGWCYYDPDCEKPLPHCCHDKCHECCEDYDCKEGEEVCNEDHECELIEMPPTEPEPASEQEPAPEVAPEEPPPYELERVECFDDEDCPEGQKCVDGQCVEAEPGCTDDAGCGADEECVDGKCVKPKPTPAPPEPADTTGPVISYPYPPDAEMGHCCIGPNCEGLPTEILYSATVIDPSGVLRVEWRCRSCAGEPEQNRGDFVRGEGDEYFYNWVPHLQIDAGEFTYSIDAWDTLGNTSSWAGTVFTFRR